MGAACLAARSAEVKQWLEVEARHKGMEKTCAISGGGCRGLCVAGPTVTVEPENVLYGQVKATDAADIIASLGKEPVKRLHRPTDKPFFTRQQRIVLEMAGRLNPERIEEYIAAGGYSSLLKAVTEMTPYGGHQRDHPQRAARARRRGLSHRVEVENGRQSAERAQICHLQR